MLDRLVANGLLPVLLLCLVSSAWAQPSETANSIRQPPPPDERTFKREIQLRYREPLKKNQLTSADKALLAKAAHYLVFQLIKEDEKFDRASIRRKIHQDLRSKNTSDAGRQYMLEQLAFRCGQLLQEPLGEHKLQGALLLSELNTAYSNERGVPDVPYVGAYQPLLKCFELDDRFIDTKSVAAEALGRILRDGEPALTIRIEIAKALAAEINRLVEQQASQEKALDIGRTWHLWKVTTALGFCNRIYDLRKVPEFPDALMAVLANDRLDWLSRARAAHSLSRLPYDSSSNLAVINFETARLTRDMVRTYNEKSSAWSLWRLVAGRIYATYETEHGSVERSQRIGLMYQVERPGLGKYKAEITEARDLILPILNTLLANPPQPPTVRWPKINPSDIEALSKWLEQHDPGTRKITPQSREIRRTKPDPGMAQNRGG